MLKMVLAFFIVWALAGEIQAASAPAKLVIAFAAMNARTAPLWAAQDQGFFNKYGVDAETIFVGGAPILLAAMTSGDIHVGYTGGTAVLGAAVSGSDLKILATLTNRVTYDLVARQGIKNPEELRSKSIGVVSIGGTNWMGTILGLEKLGLDPSRDNINLRVLGDDSVRVQALVAGTIDATALDGVYSRRLHERGFPIIAEFGKLNLPIVSTGVVARKAYIDSRPAAVENVLKALLEGNAFVLAPANKATTLKIIQRHLKVGEREAEEGYKDMAIGLERKPLPSLDGLRNAQRLMKLRNPKLETVKVEELVDDRILRRLDDSGFFDRLSVNAGAK
jgi:ABC-type nitrate/sulfonate/bicarbonate transport system substrate-binding protein